MSDAASRSELRVTGVRAPGSLGITRYADRLAAALRDVGVDYEVASRPQTGRRTHFHLGNSSRRPALDALRARPFVTTLHDVGPRTRALEPLYRAFVYPAAVGRAEATIVHSRFAADMVRGRGVRPKRTEVIALPAAAPERTDRAEARRALGLPDGALVAVLPGVIKPAKLVGDAIVAAAGTPWLLVLAGRAADRGAVREARVSGAVVLEDPGDREYEQAIVAADVVLCLRERSVGETNGPLLDALGAHRAVLATVTGSIPEVAGEAARYVEASARAIADGLTALADEGERSERERAAAQRAATLTWSASARAHADLFRDVFER